MKRFTLLAVLLGLVGSTQAATIDLGALHIGQVIAFSDDNLVGSFSDSYTVDIVDPLATAANPANIIVQWFKVRVGAFNVANGFQPDDFGVYGFETPLKSSTFSFAITGNGGANVFSSSGMQFLPGSYYAEITAVPEADTWLMILVGAGFLVWRMRRLEAE